jgi:hypothetical protein
VDPASFGPVRQLDAGPLNVGYVEVGPPNRVLKKSWLVLAFCYGVG